MKKKVKITAMVLLTTFLVGCNGESADKKEVEVNVEFNKEQLNGIVKSSGYFVVEDVLKEYELFTELLKENVKIEDLYVSRENYIYFYENNNSKLYVLERNNKSTDMKEIIEDTKSLNALLLEANNMIVEGAKGEEVSGKVKEMEVIYKRMYPEYLKLLGEFGEEITKTSMFEKRFFSKELEEFISDERISTIRTYFSEMMYFGKDSEYLRDLDYVSITNELIGDVYYDWDEKNNPYIEFLNELLQEVNLEKIKESLEGDGLSNEEKATLNMLVNLLSVDLTEVVSTDEVIEIKGTEDKVEKMYLRILEKIYVSSFIEESLME